jgi:glycosyltransferase involved in cell wall biosynthesis
MPPTTSPRTVLHLVWELDDGGLELMLTSLLGTLQRQRYEPFLVVFGPEGDLSEAVSRLGVPVHHLNVQRGSELRRACETLARMIRHIGPDLIHAWSRPGDLLSAIKPDSIGCAGVPMVTSSLSAPEPKGLKNLFIKNDSADLRTLPIRPAVDLTKLRPDDVMRVAMRERHHIPQDAVVVGMSARHLPPPDYSSFFRAVADMQGLLPNLHAVLTGRDARADHPEIAKLRATCPRPDRIHFLGVATEMAKIMPGWDLTVNAVTSAKVLPLSIAESLACGVPVVSTDYADAANFLQDAGRVVKPGDAAALKDACIDILCRQPEARRAFSIQARSRAVAAFDIAQTVQLIEERYAKLLEE